MDPAPPGVAGLHNVLMDAKRGRAPARWFSQNDPATSAMARSTRFALPAIRLGARLAGLRLPAPEHTDLDHADHVLAWMDGRCVVRGFASAMVRLAERARAQGRDLHGVVLFTGGEPLTDGRRALIESTGASVFPRHAATEAGVIGAGCSCRTSTDDMHVYTDRVALISDDTSLLVTTPSSHTGVVLFNTDLGDSAR